MADNSSLPVASGNETFANDDIGGVKYPRPKINWGPDGTANDVDVASGKPLPVQLRSPTGTDLTGTAGTASAAVITVQGIASGTPQSVTGTITAVTALTNALPAGTNNIGDIDVLTVNGVAPAFGAGTSGATVQRVVVASDQLASSITTQGAFSAGAQQVSLPSDHPTIPVTPAGNVAHDAADSGNPQKIGAKATTSLAGLTLVADADRTNLFAGVDGVQITRPHANLEDLLTPVPVAITDGSSTSVMASAGAGVKNYVTTCIIANTSATAVTVDLRDGAAGTVKATFPVPANTSGVVCNFPVPLGFSAATAVCADPSAAASTITVTLLGFKSKV